MKTIVICSRVCFIRLMKTVFLEKIEARDQATSVEAQELVKRLYELGLRPGIEFQVVGKVSFNSVTIIQYGQTRLALNEQEMACLHGRS